MNSPLSLAKYPRNKSVHNLTISMIPILCIILLPMIVLLIDFNGMCDFLRFLSVKYYHLDIAGRIYNNHLFLLDVFE